MGRYRHIEQRAYQRGVEDASAWLRTFLQHGGAVAAGKGWDNDLAFRSGDGGSVMTCPLILPHLNEWQRHEAERRSER